MSKVSYFPVVCLDKKVKKIILRHLSVLVISDCSLKKKKEVISDCHPTLDTPVMIFIRLLCFMPN